MSTPAPETLLRVNDLSVAFLKNGQFEPVTHGVSFEVKRSRVLGIVGESGSGKSVSSLAVMGLLPADFSRIARGNMQFFFEGACYDLTQLTAEQHRKLRGRGMGMIFQEPMTALNPVMRCGEQVAEAIRVHEAGLSESAIEKRVFALFEEVLLPRPAQMLRAYPHELSGGQRQRVMIAMALACNPALLIADEPTTALDVTVQATILELLRALSRSRGLGVIFITHDLGVVARLADEVLVMHQGRVVEQGSVRAVFEQPQQAYTQGLLACRPELARRAVRLLTVRDFLEQAPGEPPSLQWEAAEDRANRHALLYAQEPLLKVRDLRLWYPVKAAFWQPKSYVKAVDGVSFEVYAGETLGLVGESGSGKSTIGRAVARLAKPSSGELWYAGQSVYALKGAAYQQFRREVQVIFQDPYGSLNPRMSIGDALREPLVVHGLRKGSQAVQARLLELLDMVGLPAASLQKYPHEFSGGQRQRIVIARCLALEPKFVICDESVSALDVSVQAQVLNLLKSLQEELSLTYVFISHDLSVVKHLSDRVMVLKNGKMEELQEADALYRQPQSDYTQKLMAAIPEVNFNEHGKI